MFLRNYTATVPEQADSGLESMGSELKAVEIYNCICHSTAATKTAQMIQEAVDQAVSRT